jgi:hypothetical protein
MAAADTNKHVSCFEKTKNKNKMGNLEQKMQTSGL